MAEWGSVLVRVRRGAMRGSMRGGRDRDAIVRQLWAQESELPGRAVDGVERVHGRRGVRAERDAGVRGRGDADVHFVVYVGQLRLFEGKRDGALRLWRGNADAQLHERGVGELERLCRRLRSVGGMLCGADVHCEVGERDRRLHD